MRVHRQVFFLLTGFVVFFHVKPRIFAQGGLTASDYAVREWHHEDGLPHEDVYHLLQDWRGYLWIADRTGLSRFDGTSFRSYTEPEARQTFYGMGGDLDGSLLLTPRSGDPVRYRDGMFYKEPLPAPYSGQTIGQFLLAPDGAYWFSIRSMVLRVSRTGVEVFDSKEGIADQGWTRFAVDGQKRVWLASDGFLGCYDQGRLSKISLPSGVSDIRIASSKGGGPWVVTSTQILKIDARDQAEEIAKIPVLLGSRYVNVACEDRNGLLWIGSRSLGVHIIAEGRYIQVPTSSETILTMLEDRDGTIWTGATAGGLSAIAPKVYTLYDRSHGLTTIAASSVCEDTAGGIWVANGDGGVARIYDSRVEKWPLQLVSRIVGAGSVTRHSDGGIWAVGGSDLFRVTGDADAALVTAIPPGSLHPTCLTARNGDLWVATKDRRVAWLHNGTYRVFGSSEGVSSAGMRTFAETDSGEILVGTNDGSVLKFDGTRFLPALRLDSKAPSAINAIVSIKQRLWLGTAGHGIALYSSTGMARIDSSHGLPEDNITQMVSDDHGNFWCGSGGGVFRVRISDLERVARGEIATISAFRLGKDEGLRTITCQGLSGPGAAKSRDGRVWFATRQGVLAINPAAEALTPRAPMVAIEQIRMDAVSHDLTRVTRVNPATRKLEIHFSVLCLAAPSRAQIRYRLSGFDSEWTLGGPGVRVANYPRLAPGRYRFDVTASFGGQGSEESTASIDLVVPRRWWQTVWFQFAALGGLVAGVGLLVRTWSHRRLRHRIEKLEREGAVARERARIAQNIHDDVGASLTRISLLTQASSPQSPDAANLNRIYETAAEITRSLDEIVWAVNPHDDTLESFVSYLTDFAQKFLDAAKIRCRLNIPPALPATALSSEVRHDLFLCVRESLNNIVKHAAASEVVIRLEFSAPTLRLTIEDNGRGIALASQMPPSADRISSGHGMGNIRQRIERLGGSMTVDSPESGGTVLAFNVPIGSTHQQI